VTPQGIPDQAGICGKAAMPGELRRPQYPGRSGMTGPGEAGGLNAQATMSQPISPITDFR
jgi:hypothetical protein